MGRFVALDYIILVKFFAIMGHMINLEYSENILLCPCLKMDKIYSCLEVTIWKLKNHNFNKTPHKFHNYVIQLWKGSFEVTAITIITIILVCIF